MSAPTVWKLTPEDSEHAGAVLGRAFMDEPILLAVLDPALIQGSLPRRWAAFARLCCRFGEAWAVGTVPGEIAGVAIWIREPAPPFTDEIKAEFGFPSPDLAVDSAMSRVNAMVAQAEEEFGELPATWRYLAMIGIEPTRQGQGLGSALLRTMLDDAAEAGEVVTLVTARPANVPFYERAGMELAWRGTSNDGSVPLWSFRTR